MYSSVRNFVIAATDENGKNRYITNNNQFTACIVSYTVHVNIPAKQILPPEHSLFHDDLPDLSPLYIQQSDGIVIFVENTVIRAAVVDAM